MNDRAESALSETSLESKASASSVQPSLSVGADTIPLPSIHGKLEDLIRWCLNLDYISESCKDGIRTGNHYQSVRLGGENTKGFRTDRSEFLDRINFRGAKVLDLGSNLGEISRAARARGADVVDGFEYDPFFVQVAELINVYNAVARVSFFQRDITSEATYGEEYDIVMALAVWTYVAPLLNSIAKTTPLLLVETHNLDGNLQEHYIDRLKPFFPSYVVLGESDWGRTQDDTGGRAVLLCAKSDRHLDQALLPGTP